MCFFSFFFFCCNQMLLWPPPAEAAAAGALTVEMLSLDQPVEDQTCECYMKYDQEGKEGEVCVCVWWKEFDKKGERRMWGECVCVAASVQDSLSVELGWCDKETVGESQGWVTCRLFFWCIPRTRSTVDMCVSMQGGCQRWMVMRNARLRSIAMFF